MTHKNVYTYANNLAEKGLDAVPELIRVLINNAMQVERSSYCRPMNASEQKIGKVTSTGISQRPSERELASSLSRYRKFEREALAPSGANSRRVAHFSGRAPNSRVTQKKWKNSELLLAGNFLQPFHIQQGKSSPFKFY